MNYNTHISIIIPVLNQEIDLDRCLRHLMAHGKQAEIIVVDGGSRDSSVAVAQDYPVKVYASEKGRAVQMNLGAKKATRDILYFLQPDTLPPDRFVLDIYNTMLDGFEAGCFRVKYQSQSWTARMEKILAKYGMKWSGSADHSLFLFREKFLELGGFDESLELLEDFDLIDRLKAEDAFHVVENEIEVSKRKYAETSFFRLQFAQVLVYQMYRLGYHHTLLKNTYLKLLQRP